jgi:endonuclease-3
MKSESVRSSREKRVRSTPGRSSSLKDEAARLEEILARFAQQNPDPKCELYYETPFQLLVAVVLSAQATDVSVNKAMREPFSNGLDAYGILKLGVDGFLAIIRSIGLAPTKAKNVLALSRIVVDRYAGSIPRTREELEDLPGVGRKTANVILGEIYREPTLAVDTHVFRVGARLGWHAQKTPETAERELLQRIEAKHLPNAHHWLILHGRYVCKAQNPQCQTCIVSDLCPTFASATPAKA